jgi:hypothetical protein
VIFNESLAQNFLVGMSPQTGRSRATFCSRYGCELYGTKNHLWMIWPNKSARRGICFGPEIAEVLSVTLILNILLLLAPEPSSSQGLAPEGLSQKCAITILSIIDENAQRLARLKERHSEDEALQLLLNLYVLAETDSRLTADELSKALPYFKVSDPVAPIVPDAASGFHDRDSRMAPFLKIVFENHWESAFQRERGNSLPFFRRVMKRETAIRSLPKERWYKFFRAQAHFYFQKAVSVTEQSALEFRNQVSSADIPGFDVAKPFEVHYWAQMWQLSAAEEFAEMAELFEPENTPREKSMAFLISVLRHYQKNDLELLQPIDFNSPPILHRLVIE